MSKNIVRGIQFLSHNYAHNNVHFQAVIICGCVIRLTLFSTGDFDDGQLDVDGTVATVFRVLQECSVKVVGKKEKDSLRKSFLDSDVVNSFSEAAVSLIRKLGGILTDAVWDEWTKSSTKNQFSVSGKEVDHLQALFSLDTVPADSQKLANLPGLKSSKILNSIKQTFSSEPVTEEKQNVNGHSSVPRPSDNYVRDQPSSAPTSDLVRLLIKEQFVSSDSSSNAIEDVIPVIESLLIGDAPEESLQSEVSNLR